jgi:crotonobetainyl-CoA:carnitine CoA-transferase CaiB-like acyl-CoA transferase
LPPDEDVPTALPLAGIRVADFSRVLAGPLATMLLGDLGADVVKVERPGTGDDTRGWGPPFVGDDAAYFLSLNRNKRSVALDLGTEDGRTAARRLALASDVVVENFRPGLMEGFGSITPRSRRSTPGSCTARSRRSARSTPRLGRATTSSCRPSRA